jgi:hypothetical protein
MSSDDERNPGKSAPPVDRLGGQAPMSRNSAGVWTMGLTGGPDGITVDYERAGGIVRISGITLVRHPLGDVRQPVTIVVRQEDAARLGPMLTGTLGRIM